MIKAVFFDTFGVIYRHREVNERVISLAEDLKTRYQIGIISNVSRVSFDSILDKDRQAMFDIIVLSDEVGSMKPAPEIYQLAADRLQLAPEQCLFIDDSLTNVEGAARAGMHGIVYENFESMRESLKEVGIDVHHLR